MFYIVLVYAQRNTLKYQQSTDFISNGMEKSEKKIFDIYRIYVEYSVVPAHTEWIMNGFFAILAGRTLPSVD